MKVVSIDLESNLSNSARIGIGRTVTLVLEDGTRVPQGSPWEFSATDRYSALPPSRLQVLIGLELEEAIRVLRPAFGRESALLQKELMAR